VRRTNAETESRDLLVIDAPRLTASIGLVRS
jgi:hypothetical protein